MRRLWNWLKRKRDEESPDHSEAEHARARAIEDKHKAEAKWLPVVDVTARVIKHAELNGFGEDLKQVMGMKRGK